MPIGPQKASKANSNHRLLIETDLTPAGDGMGGLDHWLCLARPRLNTCIHACKLFPKDGGVALKFSGSCSSADIPALSSPRLGRAVAENVR